MRGYAYVDLDRNIIYKTADYIETVNPGFFSQNSHLIIRHWYFDTDQPDTLRRMLSYLSDLKISTESVKNFLGSINFDLSKLKQNANKV